ncbi:MAG: hypothetical protein MZW92_62205 [Comamonadaceae bacterium]|nr:hypothetical protein [Comamonadaceae bacterium]
MAKRPAVLIAFGLLLAAAAAAQYTPWLYWTFLPKAQMDEIVGETVRRIGLEHRRRDQRLQPAALRRRVHRQLPGDPGRRPQAQGATAWRASTS